MEGTKTLSSSLLGAMKLYEKVNDDDASAEELDVCLDRMHEVLDMIRTQDMFSKGEQLDDWTTESLKYFPVEFYLGHALGKWPEMAQRAKKLELSKMIILAFLQRCVDGEVSSATDASVDLKEYMTAVEEGRDPSLGKSTQSVRESKIAAFKAEKARKGRIKQLISHLTIMEQSAGEDTVVDTEDDKRELYILQIQSCISKAVDEISMMNSELEILKHRSAMIEEGGEEALERFRAETPGPHESNGIEVTRINKVDGQLFTERDVIKSNVFKPRFQAPTMTLEELAQQEMEQLRERERQAAEAGPNSSGPRRYEHLVRDGDEDNAELVEEAAHADREWDAWKEENPKGWGNRQGKRF